MPCVNFLPSEIRIEQPSGTSLLEAAAAAGLAVSAECGGEGVCGKCLVRLISGHVAGDPGAALPRALSSQGYILACQAKLLSQDVCLELAQPEHASGQFAETLEDLSGLSGPLTPSPGLRALPLQVAEPRLEDGLSDLDRLLAALECALPGQKFSVALPLLRSLAELLRLEQGRVTAIIDLSEEPSLLAGLISGQSQEPLHALAVDIGTTSIAVSLVSLASGRTLATQSAYNAQVSRGLDVISRINYAAKPERLSELRDLALSTINDLLAKLCAKTKVAAGRIFNAYISANTTMTHLALALPPEYIRLEPYTPTLREVPTLRAFELGLNIAPAAPVRFAPCVGSYVGGDITAGLLCCDLSRESDAISLFLDVGTNGEMVVGNRDFLICCACSAGPAFEGGGIGCGMAASQGAIERVSVDPATCAITYSSIGAAPPRGICGSGMLSLAAGLFRAGWLDQAGKFDRERQSPHIVIDGKRARLTLVPASESPSGLPLVISETDIENILRAKAAIYCAAELLLSKLGLGFADLDKFYVAGGFGRFLDIEDSITLGLLPDISREKFHFLGNSSLHGSRLALCSLKQREKLREIAQRMTYLELMSSGEYMDGYTAALFIPHTQADKFPTVSSPRRA